MTVTNKKNKRLRRFLRIKKEREVRRRILYARIRKTPLRDMKSAELGTCYTIGKVDMSPVKNMFKIVVKPRQFFKRKRNLNNRMVVKPGPVCN